MKFINYALLAFLIFGGISIAFENSSAGICVRVINDTKMPVLAIIGDHFNEKSLKAETINPGKEAILKANRTSDEIGLYVSSAEETLFMIPLFEHEDSECKSYQVSKAEEINEKLEADREKAQTEREKCLSECSKRCHGIS